jgi:hypothetical protein
MNTNLFHARLDAEFLIPLLPKDALLDGFRGWAERVLGETEPAQAVAYFESAYAEGCSRPRRRRRGRAGVRRPLAAIVWC